MSRSQTYFLGNVARCGVHRPPEAPAQARQVLIGVMLSFLVGFAAASAAPAQEQEGQETQQRQERPLQGERQDPQEHAADWATDNLDLVSASLAQIREVLAKDPGLMVELKRLMAKQAIERGQIVAEPDLADDAILDRLAADIRFRALATRLLQRYGYLTPQLNPLSPSGKEQELLLKAKADRLARTAAARDTDLKSESESPEAPCEPGRNNPGCLMQTNSPGQEPEPEPSGASCALGEDNAPCPEPPSQPALYPANPAASGLSGTGPALPNPQQPDLAGASLMAASAVSTTGQPRARTQTGALRSEDLADVTGGIPGALPENASRRWTRPLVSTRRPNANVIPEPVEMVRSPNPYADVPSLYDLYMQAAPRVGRLERFGLEVFQRDPGNVGVPMDLPAGPEYVLGPGDGLTLDLWGGVSQRLFRFVDREGRLSLPEVGPLLVSGKTLGEVQEVVQRILRSQYRDVSADLSLGRLRTVRVYVMGEVVSLLSKIIASPARRHCRERL